MIIVSKHMLIHHCNETSPEAGVELQFIVTIKFMLKINKLINKST